MSCGKNVKLRRNRRHEITAVILRVEPDLDAGSTKRGPHEDSRRCTYGEVLESKPLLTLKLIDPQGGGFRRWSNKDSFRPGRFNPDSILRSRIKALE